LAHIREISNGHISAKGRPIHFMFGCTVGFFSRSGNRLALFPVSPAILKNSNGDIYVADRPIYSVFGSRMGVFGVGGSNGAISGFAKSKIAAQPPSPPSPPS